MRKVLFGLLVIAFGVAVYWSYVRFNESEEPDIHPLRAVPSEAALIIQSNGFSVFWNKFSETNIAWQALIDVPAFKNMDSTITLFNNELETFPALDDRFNKSPVCWSYLGQGKETHFLLTCNLRRKEIYADWKTLLLKLNFTQQQEQQHEGVGIDQFLWRGNKYYCANSGQLLHFSSSLSVIQSSISKTNKGEQVDPTLQEVYATASGNNSLALFIQPNQLTQFLSSDIAKSTKSWLVRKGKLGNWSELDLSADANAFHLNGFTSSDSISSYFGALSGHRPQYNECLIGIPNTVSNFKWWAVDDYSSFMNSGTMDETEADQIQSLSGFLESDIKSHVASWMDNQFASFSLGESDRTVICRSNGSVEPIAKVSDYLTSDSATFTYMNKSIYLVKPELPIQSAFKETENLSICFILDDYVYFSSDLETGKKIIASITNGHSLATEESFSVFCERELSEKSNFIYYATSPFNKTGIGKYLGPNLTKVIHEHPVAFRGFKRLVWQISGANNGLTYHNIGIEYNGDQTEAIASNYLWEISVDAPVIAPPQLIKNHRTRTEEVLVQDENNFLYLISSAGNLKWKKQLDGPIMGKVKQIDVYANGKFQMLFNTANRIYLLDINGNHVQGFPVNLPAFATNSLSVFDYDKNHNYRILVGANGGKVYNFDKTGKKVDGWEFNKATANVSSSVEHYVIGNKDYICFFDQNGKIYALDRRGRERYVTKGQLPKGAFSGQLVQGRSIGTSKIVYCDSSGATSSQTFDGMVNVIRKDSSGLSSCPQLINYENNNLINLLVTKPNGVVEIVASDNSLLKYLEIPLNGRVSYRYIDGTNCFISLGNNELALHNDFGEILVGFPEDASVFPAISDMNRDGKLDLIIVSGDRVKARTVEL